MHEEVSCGCGSRVGLHGVRAVHKGSYVEAFMMDSAAGSWSCGRIPGDLFLLRAVLYVQFLEGDNVWHRAEFM